jgi:hypothetical protein
VRQQFVVQKLLTFALPEATANVIETHPESSPIPVNPVTPILVYLHELKGNRTM